jgi:FdhD protein
MASPEPTPTRKRGGRLAHHALVDEVPVWLEVNGTPTVTWMCTPELLEELAIGWLHGEGYIRSTDDLASLRPCATDLGFWADVSGDLVDAVRAERRTPVLASGCGSVSVMLADPSTQSRQDVRGPAPDTASLRVLFKEVFARGERYKTTGGIHAAALTDGETLFNHAEDIGRHNAVDKVIGAALLDRRAVAGLGLLVTGRISAELAFKAARAGLDWVATPSVPSTIAARVAARTGMYLVGRAVSGTPHVHHPHA